MAEQKTPAKTYHGLIIPMVTPLTAQGELDESAVRRILDFLVTGGAHGIFVLGTTGEGASAPRDMRSKVVRLAVEYTNGRAQVYAGIANTVVEDSLEAAKDYLRHGVSAVVASLPGYYILTPDEQFHYFTALAERIRGPIILYDIPAAVRNSIDPGVVEHLRAFPNVVGIKDSSGDRERLRDLVKAYGDDAGFAVLVGTTALASFGLQRGADGFVPSLGNLNPSLCARMYASAQKGDWALMEDLQREIDAAQEEFSGETIGRSIARLKKEMAKRGLCGPRVFLPLVEEE
jgi:dihydrodipicolinate synthase/N-acetylneuraminate lyase